MRVLLIDPQPLLRDAVTALLQRSHPSAAINVASTVEGALETGVDGFSLIVFGDAPGVDMAAGLALFRSRGPETPILVLSSLENQVDIAELVQAGATAVVRKTDSVDMVSGAIRLCLGGGAFVSTSSERNQRQRKELSQGVEGFEGPTLTRRQGQVLNAIARGLSNRDIAAEFGLAEGTVKIHVAAIFKTLGVSNRTQAVLVGRRLGIVIELF
ncbi:MAG: response regulator transcription factor [Alphaproteobacteria bacterium]|nr:response regulator transcription factor [Alphaproteobacteria bacterium]